MVQADNRADDTGRIQMEPEIVVRVIRDQIGALRRENTSVTCRYDIGFTYIVLNLFRLFMLDKRAGSRNP